MTTFDIQSLFANIPLDETIDICFDKVFEKRKKVKDILKRHFKQFLILLIFLISCFLFNDNYYK